MDEGAATFKVWSIFIHSTRSLKHISPTGLRISKMHFTQYVTQSPQVYRKHPVKPHGSRCKTIKTLFWTERFTNQCIISQQQTHLHGMQSSNLDGAEHSHKKEADGVAKSQLPGSEYTCQAEL